MFAAMRTAAQTQRANDNLLPILAACLPHRMRRRLFAAIHGCADMQTDVCMRAVTRIHRKASAPTKDQTKARRQKPGRRSKNYTKQNK